MLIILIYIFHPVNNVIFWYKGPSKEAKDTLIFVGQNRAVQDDRYVIESDHSLSISNVSIADEDTYRCIVIPDNATLNVKLIVKLPVQALIFQGGRELTDRSITYRQNEKIEFECKATSTKSDQVKFIWSADGNVIHSNEHIKVDGGRLTIPKANRGHNRVYQCLADEGEGTGHASVTINVLCKFNLGITFMRLITSVGTHLMHTSQIHHEYQCIDR